MQEYNEHVHVLLTTKSAEAISLLSSSLPSRVRVGSKPCADSSLGDLHCQQGFPAVSHSSSAVTLVQHTHCSTWIAAQHSAVQCCVIKQRCLKVDICWNILTNRSLGVSASARARVVGDTQQRACCQTQGTRPQLKSALILRSS